MLPFVPVTSKLLFLMTVSLYSQDSIVINSSYLEDTEGHPSSPFAVLCGFDPTNPGGSDLPAISPF